MGVFNLRHVFVVAAVELHQNLVFLINRHTLAEESLQLEQRVVVIEEAKQQFEHDWGATWTQLLLPPPLT